jgi:hypothetical protein
MLAEVSDLPENLRRSMGDDNLCVSPCGQLRFEVSVPSFISTCIRLLLINHL